MIGAFMRGAAATVGALVVVAAVERVRNELAIRAEFARMGVWADVMREHAGWGSDQ